MQIILRWSVADEEKRDADEVDESTQHELCAVQAKDSPTNSLFSEAATSHVMMMDGTNGDKYSAADLNIREK